MTLDHRLVYTTILIVTTDRETGLVLERGFSARGCLVAGPCINVSDAISWLVDHCADVVLLDARLGGDLVARFKEHCSAEGISVLSFEPRPRVGASAPVSQHATNSLAAA